MVIKKPESIRVFLLGGQHVVIAGLRLLLEEVDGFTVVGEAVIPSPSDGHSDGVDIPLPSFDTSEAIPDVILLDIDGGAECLLPVLAPSLPRGARLMILGSALDQATLEIAFKHRVTGAVLKSEPPDIVIDAVRKVHDGHVWLDQSSTTRLVVGLSETQHSRGPEARRAAALTPRERQVVALVGEGLTNGQLAQRLSISQVTVRNHLTSVFRKLRLSSRFQLALYAFKYGLSKLPPKFRPRRPSSRAQKAGKRSAS